MGDEFSLEDALIIIQRRLLYFLLPVLLLAPLGILFVILLPAKYTAQGIILVESAQIPSDLVQSTIDTYAQERIQMIRQRVMTRNRLLEISDKYQLFPPESGLSASERVQKMREQFKVTSIRAEGRSSGQRDGTIAFTVSYTDKSPDKAFQVANEFMSLFLTEDVRSRTAGASNTTEFFEREVRRLSNNVDELEQRIASYKSEHAEALPEHLNMHLDMLERATADLAANESSLATLDEEIRFLESQLTSYFAGASPEGGPASELADLKSQLVRLRAVYRDAHPSVQAVKDQINALEGELRPSRDIQNMQSELATAENDLNDAQGSLSEDDPALAEKRQRVNDLQARLTQRIQQEAQSGSGDFLSAQLQGRLSVANSRRTLLENRRTEIERRIADLQARIARTPEVERGLQGLTRDYNNIYNEYQDVLAKKQEAQLAENLEDDQKAEKFSILEPAQRPEEPSSPDRLKLSILAIFAAFAVGGGVALGTEFLFGTLRGRNHLEKLIEGHPIAVVPHFRRESDKRIRHNLFKGRGVAAAQAAGASAVAAASLFSVSVSEGSAAETQENVKHHSA